MAVAIRLRREGSKDRPFYHIVVTDSRARREGKYIEQIGTYDPMKTAVQNYSIDMEKAEAWIANGAKPSETVNSMIKKSRKAAAGK
jgi:small subunit ribosomal protein S16